MSLTTLNNLISNNLTQGGLGDTITGAELRAVMAAMVDTLSKTVTLSGNAIPFNRIISYCGQSTLASDIVYTKDTTDATPGMGAILRLVGNGTNAPVLTNFKVSNISQAYDNTNGIINVLVFLFDGVDYWVTVFQEESASVIPTLSAPGAFLATVNSSTQITLTWTDVANESSYTLDRSTSADFSTSLVSVSKAAGSTSHVASGLVAGTHYYFRIRSIGDGVSYLSSPYVYDDDTTTGADTTAPTVTSRNTTSATNIRIVFSEVVTATNVGHSFKKNGSALVPSAVSGSGTNTLDFTVPTMAAGDTLLHSYDGSTGNTLDGASNELANFTDQAVTNNIVGIDSDAQAFITAEETASGTTLSDTVKNGLSAYIAGLKAASLWTTKCKAIYPFVGTGLRNARTPGNTDADFRLTVLGGSPVFDASGLAVNGDDKLSTHLIPATHLGTFSEHHSFAYTGTGGTPFGQTGGGGDDYFLVTATPGGAEHFVNGVTQNLSAGGSLLSPEIEMGRENDGSFAVARFYRNGTLVASGSQALTLPPTGGSSTVEIHLACNNNNGSGGNLFMTGTIKFHAIFLGLTTSEIATVRGLKNSLLTALGR